MSMISLTGDLTHRLRLLVTLALGLGAAACAAEHEVQPLAQVAQARSAALSGPTQSSIATPATDNKLVWVVMKDRANLEQARKVSDWGARGAAVRDALLETATTKQQPIQRFLAGRASSYESYWIVNALRVRADAETIEQLKARPDVAQVSTEHVYSIPEPQPSAAGASVSAATSALEWGLANIRAPQAWQSFGSHGEGIVIASIDSGVQFDHPALVRQYRGNQYGSIDHNYNWYDPSRICGNPSLVPCDNTAHGTHTMGTMVGLDDSGEHQIGVAPGARWIAAKGCEDHFCSTDALLKSAQWLLAPTDLNGKYERPDLRPNIISNSWGSVPGDIFLEETVQVWLAAGIFPVFAAGNGGPACGTANSPSDYPESYSVAAYDRNNLIASFSARGSGALGATKPNIAAPGVDVRSSVPGNGYYPLSGTSMATPHVAGAVALLWSAVPSLIGDIASTRALLDQSALDMGDWNCGGDRTNNATWGEGRLDVYNALAAATSDSPARGQLQGNVKSGAKLLAHATLTARAEGYPDRFILTNDDGSYQLALPVGSYSLETRAFGFVTQTLTGVVITDDATRQENIALVQAPAYSVSGTVVDEKGAAVPFATVSAIGAPLAPVAADALGRYTLANVPQGSYTLSFDAYGCYVQQHLPVVVSAPVALDVTLIKRHDKYGYSCKVSGESLLKGSEPLMTAGDDQSRTFQLPFPFLYYGKEYSRATVSINGALSFEAKPISFANDAVPSPAVPNAAIYALWHDFVLDSSSGVFTQVLGAAPRRLAVIEWRNVYALGDRRRYNFAIVLHESGEVTLQYGASGQAKHYGELATIGMEDQTGTDGLMYSYYRASIVPGMSIRYAVPGAGVVRGTVTDGNDRLPLAGVELAAMSGSTRLRTTRSDDQGRYLLQVPAGATTVVVSAKHYAKASRAVTVSAGQTAQADFALQTATVALDDASQSQASPIELVVAAGKSKTRALELKNLGSAPLAWAFQQSAPAEHEAGEVLETLQPGLLLPWGVGMADNLWVSDLYAQTNVELSRDGVATGRVWSAEWTNLSLDMAYDSVHKLMCQVDFGPGYSIGLPCWDPRTGKVQTSITGDYPWTSVPQRGLAYDASDDTFFIGGPDLGVIYHIAGLGHDHPGEIISQCQPPDRNISGLAWNPSKRVLWEATNSPADTLFELDPLDCSVLSAIAHPAPGYNGAGLELDAHGDLWMVAQGLGSVYLVASGVPTFTSVPWLSTTPAASTLAPGDTTSVTLTVNSSGLKPGVYQASLYLESDAARAPSIPVPVRLVVTDYQRAIDAGSELDYTDSQLDSWSADRAYTNGQWGYLGESSTARSDHAIEGTDDPALYQSLRAGASGYRFDDVPNGVYEVELRFAQPSDLDRGQAQLDVIIEDELVLPDYDPSYRNGADYADDHRYFVAVSDGQLDIRFSARVGQPYINALRVTHRPDR